MGISRYFWFSREVSSLELKREKKILTKDVVYTSRLEQKKKKKLFCTQHISQTHEPEDMLESDLSKVKHKGSWAKQTRVGQVKDRSWRETRKCFSTRTIRSRKPCIPCSLEAHLS